MDIASSAISSSQALGAGSRVGDAVGISVLKKALNHQAAQATELISSVSQTTKSEPHLGQNLNVSV